MQSLLVGGVTIVVFLVLFATRDILLRTHSFLLQVFCILVVAVLPVLGFLLYLLIRPSRTLAERRLEHKMDLILERTSHAQQHGQQQGKKHQHHEKQQQQKSGAKN